MGKVYGKNASGNTQLIIDGDAIDQRLSTLETNWDSISLYTTTKENVLIPTGSAPYTQLIFNFDGIGNKIIVGVTEIWSTKPSVVRIAQFNTLNNNQLEVWVGNAVSSASSVNVRVTVAAMQL